MSRWQDHTAKRCSVANYGRDALLICLAKETINKTLEHEQRLADSKQDRRWLHQTVHRRAVEPTEAQKKEFFLLTRLTDNPVQAELAEVGASSEVRILRTQLAKERKRARKAQGKEDGEWLEDWWNSDGTSNWVGGVWTNPGGANAQEESEEDEEMQDESEDYDDTQQEEEGVEEPEHEAKEPKRVNGWAVLND